MNAKSAIIVTIISFLILSGCTSPATENPQTPTTGSGPIFKVEPGNPLFESVGAPYEITAANCQGARDSEKTEERSKTYSTDLRIEVSNTVAAEVGGDIIAAKATLSDEIGVALGVTIGAQTEIKSSVKIVTPPGQKTVAHLQWKEEWTSGTIAVSRPDGTPVDILPFSVLNSLTLEQLDVQTINCETGVAVENGSTVQIITAGDTPVPVPTSTGQADVPMVLIPSEEFSMGRVYGGEDNEKPAHIVLLEEYYIDKYEVTNQAYAACVDGGVCQPPLKLSSDKRPDYYTSPDYRNFPVVNVDWNQANTYCAWRGARLPTEAEWEKAARGVDAKDKLYPWNNEEVEESKCSFGNFAACKPDTTEVGSYPDGVSPYGVYDMAGNVWEWVADWYGFDYYQLSPKTNPLGPSTGKYRVLRGGAWNSPSTEVRVTYRTRYYPYIYAFNLGFRCAKSP
jgi:formylglycine-generating enzyme required for sulfatase activity